MPLFTTGAESCQVNETVASSVSPTLCLYSPVGTTEESFSSYTTVGEETNVTLSIVSIYQVFNELASFKSLIVTSDSANVFDDDTTLQIITT